MAHILLDLSGYIDLWLSTQLVHDLYLKSMEGHLSMISISILNASITRCNSPVVPSPLQLSYHPLSCSSLVSLQLPLPSRLKP
jgi:hypothetical protein